MGPRVKTLGVLEARAAHLYDNYRKPGEKYWTELEESVKTRWMTVAREAFLYVKDELGV